MDAQTNKQYVMEGYRLFQSGDIRSLLDRYHDDAEWIGPESDIVPFAGSYHGKQELAQFFAKLGGSVQPLRFVAQEFIAEGDKVVVILEATWLVKANGNSYDTRWVNVFTLRDGKVARTEMFSDPGPAEKAFGSAQVGQTTAGSTLRH